MPVPIALQPAPEDAARSAAGPCADDLRRSPGFTLLEVLIALAVLSLTLLIGLPNLRQILARSELNQTGRQVEILLQKARREAIKTESPVVVRASGRTVQGFVDADQDGALDAAAERVVGAVAIPARVTWVTPTTDFTFLPNGSAATLGDYGFRLEGGDSLRVRLTSLATSNVQFERSW